MWRPLRALMPAIALAVAGCASEPRRPAAPEAAERPAECGKVPRRLQGSYFMRTERGDLPPEVVDGPVGINLLLLGPEHHGFFRVERSMEHVWPVCVSPGMISFPGAGSSQCAARGTGVYRWRLAGDTLRLARVGDDCLPRVHALTVHPYRRFTTRGWNCHTTPDCGYKLTQVEMLERTGSCAAAGCIESRRLKTRGARPAPTPPLRASRSGLRPSGGR